MCFRAFLLDYLVSIIARPVVQTIQEVCTSVLVRNVLVFYQPVIAALISKHVCLYISPTQFIDAAANQAG